MDQISKIILVVIGFIAALNAGASYAQESSTQYHLKAELSDDYTTLDVSALIRTDIPSNAQLKFMLNRHAVIQSITLNGQNTPYNFDLSGPAPSEFVEESRLLSIPVHEATSERAKLNISYSIALSAVNAFGHIKTETPNVELNVYSAWFPVIENFGSFQYVADIEFPEGQKLFGNADVIMVGDQWKFTSATEGFDIVVFASPQLETLSFTTGKSAVSVTHLGADKTVVQQLSKDIPDILSNFENWFGPVGNTKSKYDFVITPRPRGTSYSRGKFAVMTDVAPEEYARLFATTGHEIGHFWWNKADSSTWQDWLNEGFSEYAAIAALTEKFGKEHTDTIWHKEEQRAASLPAIKGLARNDKNAEKVFYRKAAYLLHNLRSQSDSETFINFMKAVHAEKVTNTEQLEHLVAAHYGKTTAAWFAKQLSL
ncbi:MAG: hypothetical protein AB3N28_04630 [Kordiimonas sp.]